MYELKEVMRTQSTANTSSHDPLWQIHRVRNGQYDQLRPGQEMLMSPLLHLAHLS